MTVSKGPDHPVVLEVNDDKVELDLELHGITLPGQHQTWKKFGQLAWGKFRSLQWGRF